MIDKHFILEEADPQLFFGAGNANLRMLRALSPKLRITARDNVVRVVGDEDDIAAFAKQFTALEHHCAQYNSLTEEDILHITRGQRTGKEAAANVIVYSTGGRPITARSENQRRMVEAYETSDMIILCRPAVEAGEKLGFLPGDMKEKIDPYLQPLYDALEEMIPPGKLQEYLDTNIIQIAPLAFMRGRTLNDAVVILDEAQNTTSAQIKMFLTRMGMNTKMIVTGDRTQIDLPPSQRSGLIEAMRILRDVPGIAFIEMNKKDIVRHKLVTRIVEAYERDAKERNEKDHKTDIPSQPVH